MVTLPWGLLLHRRLEEAAEGRREGQRWEAGLAFHGLQRAMHVWLGLLWFGTQVSSSKQLSPEWQLRDGLGLTALLLRTSIFLITCQAPASSVFHNTVQRVSASCRDIWTRAQICLGGPLGPGS